MSSTILSHPNPIGSGYFFEMFSKSMKEAFCNSMITGTGIFWTGVDFAKPGADETILYKTRSVGPSTFYESWYRAPWDTRRAKWQVRRCHSKNWLDVQLPNLKLSVLAVRWAWRIK